MADVPTHGHLIPVPVPHEERDTLFGEIERTAEIGGYIWEPGRRLVWSDGLFRLLEVDPAEAPAATVFFDRVHPEDRARVSADWQRALAGEMYPTHYRIVRKDGSVRHLRGQGTATLGPDGGVARIVGSIVDVTARAELEERLQQAAKMEAVGTLAAGVAHDFNNYLMVILSHLEESRGTGGDQAPLRDALHAAEHCAVLTRQLLAFGRKQAPAMRPLDLGALAVNVAGLLRRVCRAEIVVEVEPPTRPMIVEADAGQLEGVLMNLAVNARDAMPAGGHLRFSFLEQDLLAGDPVLEPGSAPGRYTCLRVTDTGTGIPAEHLSRIFDPYFSTKDAGRGTGLGLASVYGIVRQHGGFVRVVSQVGKGTTFQVYLRSRSTRECGEITVSPGPLLAAAPLRGKRILVAEDVEAVRRTVVTGLTRAGASVVAAADGQLALEQLMSGLSVDMVLTDLVMPRMGGLELARTVRKLRPDLPLGFMTGYADRDVLGEIAVEDATVPILKKPFTLEELVTTVARALEKSCRVPDETQL